MPLIDNPRPNRTQKGVRLHTRESVNGRNRGSALGMYIVRSEFFDMGTGACPRE